MVILFRFLLTISELIWNNRLTLFYPLSAILTLFCYLISNPSDPEAFKDLEIIQQIAEQIRELGEEEGKISGEPSQPEHVWKVVMALHDLAKQTVEKRHS